MYQDSAVKVVKEGGDVAQVKENREQNGDGELAKIKRNKSCAPCMVGKVQAAKAVIFSKLNQRRRLAQRRRILTTTTRRKKVERQLEIKATKKVIENVPK